MTPHRNIDYKIQRETSRQWRMVLASMAQELTAGGQYSSCQELGEKVGMRYATQAALPACSSLRELEAATSARWQNMDWGWINLDDRGKNLLIVHHGAGNGELVADAFGEDTQSWVPAFLCGVYGQWLSSLGAGDQLRVKQLSTIDEFGTIEFELSR